MTPPCWMAVRERICFVHLGKYGDLMIMFPAFRAIFKATGIAPVCLVSVDFANIFDGITYAQPWPVELHWWKGVSKARQMAELRGFQPIVVKWWDEPNAKAPIELENGKMIKLKIHGEWCDVPANEWDSFQASQWRYAGFSMQQMIDWPLVFDRRDARREQELQLRWFRTPRQKILYNLSKTGTSPFRNGSDIMPLLFSTGCELVDLSRIKAQRIYDLLGLYDHASLLVTSDTATLHLAAASRIPYIAFLNDGGAGSIPKGNCLVAIRYNQIRNNIMRLTKILESYKCQNQSPAGIALAYEPNVLDGPKAQRLVP